MFDARTDSLLLTLKQIAAKGSENGPLFDQGVGDVVREVETRGRFRMNREASRINELAIQERSGMQVLTDEETRGVRAMLAERGWTLEQALEYADGVQKTQDCLKHFKDRM